MIPVRRCVPNAVAEVLRDQPLSAGKVRFAWQTAVGQRLARATTVQLTDGGILEVQADDPYWRREIQRSASLILARMEVLLRPAAVLRIRVREEERGEA